MKYQAIVKVNFDYTAEIEAENEEEAKSKAYDEAKELMHLHDPKLRPFGIYVIAVEEMKQ